MVLKGFGSATGNSTGVVVRGGGKKKSTTSSSTTISSTKISTKSPIFRSLIILVLCAGSFYTGVFVGMHIDQSGGSNGKGDQDCWTVDDPRLAKYIQNMMSQQQQQSNNNNSNNNGNAGATTNDIGSTMRIPQTNMGNIVYGMSRVNRDEFASKFDMGVPLDPSSNGNKDVLILYNGQRALPTNKFLRNQIIFGQEVPLVDDIDVATQNCNNLHIVLTQPNRDNQCIAIMGQYESFHIQKFMRLPPGWMDMKKGKVSGVDVNHPFQIVNRGAQQNGRKSTEPPTKEQTLQHWSVLATYLATFQDVLAKLKPIAKKVARQNTIIVMVCNFGQSELLLNFVCNARAKGLDVSNILLFATDKETKELAESIGLTSFFDETNFGRMPKGAARRYADKTFMAMMGAKVYCVQMISMLGYDVLFQDVDVVWYKDPLPYFHQDESSPDQQFDVYFQDDGNHALFYAPYSANTGFYYVRHNDRTQYFFNSLLLAGDLILSTHSHQIALIALLNEHASMYNLKVKIFERNTEEFPGGFSFHRKKDFMMNLFQDKIKPYIFHMSWTNNKDNKIKFMEQMGEWYVKKECVSKSVGQIEGGGSNIADNCCAAEAIIKCHYRDKPSKILCKDSPAIDGDHKSWWS